MTFHFASPGQKLIASFGEHNPAVRSGLRSFLEEAALRIQSALRFSCRRRRGLTFSRRNSRTLRVPLLSSFLDSTRPFLNRSCTFLFEESDFRAYVSTAFHLRH